MTTQSFLKPKVILEFFKKNKWMNEILNKKEGFLTGF